MQFLKINGSFDDELPSVPSFLRQSEDVRCAMRHRSSHWRKKILSRINRSYFKSIMRALNLKPKGKREIFDKIKLNPTAAQLRSIIWPLSFPYIKGGFCN